MPPGGVTYFARQPDVIAFTGRCLVHRAEIMQLEGEFSDALEEARRAAERCLRGENPGAAREASYRPGGCTLNA